MKKIRVLLFALSAIGATAQTTEERSNQLIAQKQYASAFNVLEAANPDHQSASILIAQTHLLLDYYVRTEKHLKFALLDLKSSDNLDSLRTNKVEYPLFKFRVDSLIYRLLEKEPDNLQLHLALGRYFLEVYQKFGGEAFYPEQMLLTRMEMHCALAYKRGAKDQYSTFALALKKLLDKEPIQAIPLLEDHLALNPGNAEAHFNLALAYQLQKRRAKSIQSALNALYLYQEPVTKAEVARLVAVTYAEVGDTNQSLKYLRLADQIEPDNYVTLSYLLQTEALVDTLSFKLSRRRFYRLAPEKNVVYQELYRLHLRFNWEKSLIRFYQEELDYFTENPLVRAKLYLHLAILYKDLEEFTACREAIIKAQSGFKGVLPANHEVFRFIESYFKNIPEEAK